jgi:quercetin dioxygenase-like cupin family protein
MGTQLLLPERATSDGSPEEIGRSMRFPTATGGPILHFDLLKERRELRREAFWSRGRNAKTLAKHGDIRVVLTITKAGEELQQHHAHGTVLIQLLQGRVTTSVLGQILELSPGHLLVLDPNLPHNVKAVEDSVVLLTIGWRTEAAGKPTSSRRLRNELKRTDPDASGLAAPSLDVSNWQYNACNCT